MIIAILVEIIVLHEIAHGFVAKLFGDRTAQQQGCISLNPVVHIDPLWTIAVPAIAYFLSGGTFIIGGAKPVPVNPYALRRQNRAGLMLVSIAGPLANLLLAILAALPFQAGLVHWAPSGALLPSWGSFLTEFIFINLILLFFNLIPIFPLDGEKVLEYFLPPRGKDTLLQLRPYGPMILLALLFLAPMLGFNILDWLVATPAEQLFRLLV